ncbi:hypothetical protein, partial [Escherichia coli]|uniref:hypothetical protein n=1 Tax=Escherichia coli TaxID=562 RepID=UPI001A8F5A7F
MRKCESSTTNKFIITFVIVFQVTNSELIYNSLYSKTLCNMTITSAVQWSLLKHIGFAPIFPDICYHLTHYKPAAADIPVASDNPAH